MRKDICFTLFLLALFLHPSEKLVAESQMSAARLSGIASWYSESDPGINRHTANGEVFDDAQMTCASWDFPFGTLLRVTHLANDRSIVCRVNDRGPARRLGRLIDLTKAAFREIAPLQAGLISVKVEEIGKKN